MSSELRKNFFEAVKTGTMFLLSAMFAENGIEVMKDLANSYNDQREMPLLIAIKRKHLNVLDFLLFHLKADIGQNARFCWNGVDHGEVPPLFMAIVTGQLSMAKKLIEIESFEKPAAGLTVLSSSSTRQQKIDALELMGAAYITLGSTQQAISRFAIPCWMTAMTLRSYSTPDGEPTLPKILAPLSENVRKSFDNVTEVTTREQLQFMTEHPISDQFSKQACLVSHRILSQKHPFTLALFYTKAQMYLSRGLLRRAINICKSIMESFDDIQLWETEPTGYLGRTLTLLTQSYQRMLRRRLPHRREGVLFAHHMKSLNLAYDLAYYLQFKWARPKELPIHSIALFDAGSFQWNWTTSCILDLISLLGEMQAQADKKEILEFKTQLVKLVRLNYKWNYSNRNLLHVACAALNVQTNVVQLLLQAGTDPNVADLDGNTPLHLLTRTNYGRYLNTDVIKLVIDAGGHLDLINKNGTTVLDLLKFRQRHLVVQKIGPNPEIRSLINNVLPLTCCCARVIRIFGWVIDDVQRLPASLQSFVGRH